MMKSISDDELIQSLCVEDNKLALKMIFDRHARDLTRFTLSWMRSPWLWAQITQDSLRREIAVTIVLRIFEELWDRRETLLNDIDGIKFRLHGDGCDNDAISRSLSRHTSVHQYLLKQARRKLYAVPQSCEKKINRE